MLDLLEAYAFYEGDTMKRMQPFWEMTRMISFFASAPHAKKIRTQTDVCVFQWEKTNGGIKGTKSNAWTQKEIQEMIANGTHPHVRKVGGKTVMRNGKKQG